MKPKLSIYLTSAVEKWVMNPHLVQTIGWFSFALLILSTGLNTTIDPRPTVTPSQSVPKVAVFPVPDPEPSAPAIAKKPEKKVSTFVEVTPETRFHSIIVRAANRYNVDAALIKAVIKAESGYNAKAISKRGAMGLMQLMPGTAQELGVVDGFDPEHNINGGVRYLKRLMDRFEGNVSLALAAYNAGSRKVRRYNGIPPFKATHIYIEKVFRYYRIYSDQMLDGVDNA